MTETKTTITTEDRLRKIRGLLAKAESTDSPEEAKALTAKASALMAAHSISESMLDAARTDAERAICEQPEQRYVYIDGGPYMGPRTTLLSNIAGVHNVQLVLWHSARYSREHGKKVSRVTLHGFPSDLDATEQLFTSCMVQSATEMLNDENDAACTRECTDSWTGKVVPARKVAWRNAFMLGYAAAVSSRLWKVRRAAEADAAAEHADLTGESSDDAERSVSLAVRARKDRVSDYVKACHPRLGRGTGSSAGSRATGGYSQGGAAGQRADLGGTRVGGTSAQRAIR